MTSLIDFGRTHLTPTGEHRTKYLHTSIASGKTRAKQEVRSSSENHPFVC